MGPKFWIVTTPRRMRQPDLGDICFETDVRNLMLQTRGGLDPEDVMGVYLDQETAHNQANQVLYLHKQMELLKDSS